MVNHLTTREGCLMRPEFSKEEMRNYMERMREEIELEARRMDCLFDAALAEQRWAVFLDGHLVFTQ